MMWKHLDNLHAIAVVHRRFPNFGLSSCSLWRRHGFTWISQQVTGLWSHFPRCTPALGAYFPLRFFNSGKLQTSVACSCDKTNTWLSVTQGQLFFSEMPLCCCQRWNEKVLANKSLRSHFSLAAWNGDFGQHLLRCHAELYLCQQVIKKLKRS